MLQWGESPQFMKSLILLIVVRVNILPTNL